MTDYFEEFHTTLNQVRGLSWQNGVSFSPFYRKYTVEGVSISARFKESKFSLACPTLDFKRDFEFSVISDLHVTSALSLEVFRQLKDLEGRLHARQQGTGTVEARVDFDSLRRLAPDWEILQYSPSYAHCWYGSAVAVLSASGVGIRITCGKPDYDVSATESEIAGHLLTLQHKVDELRIKESCYQVALFVSEELPHWSFCRHHGPVVKENKVIWGVRCPNIGYKGDLVILLPLQDLQETAQFLIRHLRNVELSLAPDLELT